MSLGTSNRDGGKTSEAGHLRAIMKAFIGEVLAGLAVSQRGAGANLSVDVAVGDAIIPRSDGTYGHPVFNDAVYNQAITTADVSNPRRDMIVMYVDYGNAVSTAVSNNTNGVVKIKVVTGTPAGSPADPSDAAIQSSVGSGNPYIKLARVRVAAGATTISNSVIDDLRAFATGDLSGGWVSGGTALAAWAFSSFSSTTKIGVITVPTDMTTKVSVGMKIRVWQLTGGWKWGFVVGVTATTITAFFGTESTLVNEAIYLPAYAYDFLPYGYGGPILQKEYYKVNNTDTVRWILEQSGMDSRQIAVAANANAYTAINFPVRYAAPPNVIVSTLGYSASQSTNPSQPNSGAGFYFVGNATTDGTGLLANLISRDAATNNGTSTWYNMAWLSRGVVA